MIASKSWSERWRQLRSMNYVEFLDRLRQHVNARVDLFAYRTGKRVDIALSAPTGFASSRFFFLPDDVPALCKLLTERFPRESEEIVRRAERICGHHFNLLGYESLDYGSPISWHCDRAHDRKAPRSPWYSVPFLDFQSVGDVKITWELNRQQHLVTLAKAYRLTGDQRFLQEILQQWHHWHAENPYPIGVNWASSLEVAMRALSWIWVYFLLPEEVREFRQECRQALGISARHIERNLSTYFSPNTHLIGEAVGLFFVGTVCPELQRARRWQADGWALLLREAQRQVRADGLHFEQSLYYHIYALDFFLHCICLAAANETPIPSEFEAVIERMLSALCLLSRAGIAPTFGDDDGGRVFDPQRNRACHMLDPLATGTLLFQRGDFKSVSGGLCEETLWLLGAQGVAEFDRIKERPPSWNSVALDASGYYLMANARSREQIAIDAGPQGAGTAGHGHADALSVSWIRDGKPLLIDPGTCYYIGEGKDRDEFRGTAAHNTLIVDGVSQADPTGPFSWRKLPKVTVEAWVTGQSFDWFVGSHDGFCRLSEPVLHRRWIFALKDRFWVVRDAALGVGKHRLDIFWHISPELIARPGKWKEFSDSAGSWGVRLIEEQDSDWSHAATSGTWSPIYGRKESAPVMRFSKETALPAEFVTLLEIAGGVRAAGQLRRLPRTSGIVEGFSYLVAEEDHAMFFSQLGEKWSSSLWSSDAEFLYWGGNGQKRLLICCNVSHVRTGDAYILRANAPVPFCEIVVCGKEVEVVCAREEAEINRDLLCTLASKSTLTSVGVSVDSDGRTR